MAFPFRSINPAKEAFSLLEGFKAFAFKGNVVDLAVGVIIGGAFAKIVTSMVNNILMPLLAVVLPSDRGYEHWVAHINGKPIPYGLFLGDLFNFLIVALALYLFIYKLILWIKSFNEKAEASEDAVVLTKDQQLLTEILEALKSRPAPPESTTPSSAV